MARSSGWKSELSQHNIKFIKNADHENMAKFVRPEAREAFRRTAYGANAWWRGADQKEGGEE